MSDEEEFREVNFFLGTTGDFGDSGICGSSDTNTTATLRCAGLQCSFLTAGKQFGSKRHQSNPECRDALCMPMQVSTARC